MLLYHLGARRSVVIDKLLLLNFDTHSAYSEPSTTKNYLNSHTFNDNKPELGAVTINPLAPDAPSLSLLTLV
jgi:hypothetical protein